MNSSSVPLLLAPPPLLPPLPDQPAVVPVPGPVPLLTLLAAIASLGLEELETSRYYQRCRLTFWQPRHFDSFVLVAGEWHRKQMFDFSSFLAVVDFFFSLASWTSTSASKPAPSLVFRLFFLFFLSCTFLSSSWINSSSWSMSRLSSSTASSFLLDVLEFSFAF